MHRHDSAFVLDDANVAYHRVGMNAHPTKRKNPPGSKPGGFLFHCTASADQPRANRY